MCCFGVFTLYNDLLRVSSISCTLSIHHAFVTGMAKWIFESMYFKYMEDMSHPMCIVSVLNAVALHLESTTMSIPLTLMCLNEVGMGRVKGRMANLCDSQ